MATAVYLEHYLDSLDSLPGELQHNFDQMRDLDVKSQDLLSKIDVEADAYLQQVKTLGKEDRKKRVTQVNRMFTKSREYGDDKVTMAMQTYELVDKHIRRLDADLARFEQELKEKALGSKESGEKGGVTARKKKRAAAAAQADADLEDEQPKKKKKKALLPAPEAESPPVTPMPLTQMMGAVGQPSDVLDMPVDPNEPTYCLCHQVSYGEMIGCDNLECPIEWFHFGCVNLTTKPKGKWYCPRCLADRKKK